MIDHFQLGFANRTLGYRLPEKNRKAGAEMRGRLQTLGILRESGHEHFNGSIVIPIFSLRRRRARHVRPQDHARICARARRCICICRDRTAACGTSRRLQASNEIILCESLIDALTFWCAGFRNVTASYGVGGFTDDHQAAFQKHGTRNVWIAYDRDEAGDAAADAAERRAGTDGHRLAPRAVSAWHGRERIRARR